MIKKLLFVLLISTTALSAQTLYKIPPTTVDTNIARDTSDYYVYINSGVTHLNKLFLFLPGSGAQPMDYTNILTTAANMGYHTIGLTYDNDSTIATDCSGQGSTCPGSARAEIFYGKNYSSAVGVDTAECIRTRLVNLLKYLNTKYPADGWGQYLDAQDSIIWSSVCVSGHSQGAGMASLIAYWYNVYRGVFFSTGGDWSVSTLSVAAWMEGPSVTPPSKKYAFTHREDELFWGKLKEAPVIWDTLGIGNYIDVDTITTNYYHGHSFTSYDSAGVPASIIKFHNCTVANYYTPTISGKLLYQPLWQYLLGDTTVATGISPVNEEPDMVIYPNPGKGVFNIRIANSQQLMANSKVEVYTMLGEKIETINSLPSGGAGWALDLSNAPSGLYFIKLTTPSGQLIKKVVKL